MRRALLLFALLVLPMASGQYQPEEPVDATPYAVREDIAAAGELAGAQRILRFAQVSDAHIVDDDAPAPLRAEIVDQIGYPIDGGSRPHEEYSDEILNSAIAAINGVHAADALDFVINTGDNIDNQLENELMRFIDNWEGTLTTVGPVSGKTCLEDGQSTSSEDASTDVQDSCTFLPSTVSANNTALADGLPWYSAFGNHDGLIQGSVPIEPSFQEAADEYGRHFIEQDDYVDMHFSFSKCIAGGAGGGPDDDTGHGYGFAGDRLCDANPDNDGYYAFSVRGVRFVVLDTVNDDFVTANENLNGLFTPQQTLGYDVIGGYAEGAIDPDQYAWLLEELDAHVNSPVILMAHHTVNSMFSKDFEGNCLSGNCLDQLLLDAGYVTGPGLTEELARRDNVLAFVGGHTHRHRIEAKVTDDGAFWNIETSALLDYPQEPRVIELWQTTDGKWFLKTDPINHDFEPGATLAANDPQRGAEAEGAATDQDVILWLAPETALVAQPQPALERVLQLRPQAVPANAGAPYTFHVDARDVLRDQPLSGLNITVAIGYTTGTGFVSAVPAGTSMESTAPGRYSLAFVPSAPNTHFATVTAVDPSDRYDTTTQVFSIIVEPGPVEAQGTPLAFAPVVLALLAAMVVRRT